MNRILVSFLLIASGAISGPVEAQNEAQSGPRRGVVEEIVVTATKRGEQSLQDLPMAITAFSEETLEIIGADDMLDYLGMVLV